MREEIATASGPLRPFGLRACALVANCSRNLSNQEGSLPNLTSIIQKPGTRPGFGIMAVREG